MVNIKQCCNTKPTWVFIYDDGTNWAICEKDSKDPAYQYGVKEIIKIETRESFTPAQIFGVAA